VEANLIWHPTLTFKNILNIEKLSSYGRGLSTKSFWLKYPHQIEYDEHIKLTIRCIFDFSKYPFDSNKCHMDFGDPAYDVENMRITTIEIYFDDQYTSIYEPMPITLSDVGLPYEIHIQAKESYNHPHLGSDGQYSYTGIKFTLTRNSLGLLIGGFYGPTAIFASLSLISFAIEATAVSSVGLSKIIIIDNR
jgi:hypothetical protein